jgi:hypothetical protein
VTPPQQHLSGHRRHTMSPSPPPRSQLGLRTALCSTLAALALAELSFELTPMQYRATKQRRRVALNPPQFVAHHLPQAPPILHAAVPSSCIYLYRKDADDFL